MKLSNQFSDVAHYAFSGFIRVLSVAANFVFSVVISRALSIDDAGTFFLLFAILSVLSFVLSFGLEHYIVRLVGVTSATESRKDGVVRFVQIAFPVILLGVVVASVVSHNSTWLSEQLFSNSLMSTPFSIIIFGVSAMTAIILIGSALQGLLFISTSIFITRIAVPVLVCGLIVVADINNLIDLSKVFLAVVWSVVLVGSLLLFRVWPPETRSLQREKIEQRDRPSLTAGILFSLGLIGVFQQLFQWSGQLIAGVFLPASDVAVLAVSQRTALLVSFVLITINAVNAPRFARLASQNKFEQLHALARRSNILVIAVGIVVFLLLFTQSEAVLGLFGSEFRANTAPLKLLVLGQLINISAGSVSTLLIMTGNYGASVMTSGIAVIVGVALGFLLTPSHGLIGASLAMVCGIVVKNILDIIWVRKRLGFYILAAPGRVTES